MTKLYIVFTIAQLIYTGAALSKEGPMKKKVLEQVRMGLWYEGIKEKRAPGGGEAKSEQEMRGVQIEAPEELVRAMEKISF